MSSRYDIEKDDHVVELRPQGRNAKYPFRELPVGHSFFVPHKTSSQIAPCIAYWHKKLPGRKFTSRMFDDEGECMMKRGVVGVRVHRVE